MLFQVYSIHHNNYLTASNSLGLAAGERGGGVVYYIQWGDCCCCCCCEIDGVEEQLHNNNKSRGAMVIHTHNYISGRREGGKEGVFFFFFSRDADARRVCVRRRRYKSTEGTILYAYSSSDCCHCVSSLIFPCRSLCFFFFLIVLSLRRDRIASLIVSCSR